jgi:hypothetical protein
MIRGDREKRLYRAVGSGSNAQRIQRRDPMRGKRIAGHQPGGSDGSRDGLLVRDSSYFPTIRSPIQPKLETAEARNIRSSNKGKETEARTLNSEPAPSPT